MPADRAYLSIVAWPPAFDQPRRADALARCLGLDRYRSNELARRATPAIFARLPMDHCAKVAEQIRDWGGTAVPVLGTHIQAALDPIRLKSAAKAPDSSLWVAQPWRGDAITFDASRITALLRAHVRAPKSTGEGDFAVQGLHQLHGTLSAADWDQGHSRRARLEVVELLDLHTLDGHHLRVIADKFSFDAALPSLAGTSRENTDALAAGFAAPARVEVNTGFETARFLAEYAPDFVEGDWRALGGFSVFSAWFAQIALASRQH
ncbi:MAG: hypothetical protein JNM80_08725 [Phycisphaerae bacterium]|nr:hypothetical protein [Phycisphaerae bacterium]